MFISTKHRTEEDEIMDDFEMEGEALRINLDEIAKINRVLGGNIVTLKGVTSLLKKDTITGKTVTIIDIGCGNGDMLRDLSDLATKKGWKFHLIGVDANEYTITYAKKLSTSYKNIEYYHLNIFSNQFEALNYDIAVSTLTLHHFKNKELLQLMTTVSEKASIGIVINDLHRSIIAYRLFQMISFVFRLSKVSSNDGLVSILRGFKKQELITFSNQLNIKKYKIHWKWAFRYQWIIETI